MPGKLVGCIGDLAATVFTHFFLDLRHVCKFSPTLRPVSVPLKFSPLLEGNKNASFLIMDFDLPSEKKNITQNFLLSF